MAERKLYPLVFTPEPSLRVWGGNALISTLGKSFTVVEPDGSRKPLTTRDAIAESWEIADMGTLCDSVVENGYLAGNAISDLMEIYLDRLVGAKVFERYGTQFPLLIKYLDICGQLSFQIHPDDETAAPRYDSLGKAEMWYVLDSDENARIYAGFKTGSDGGELYRRCHDGSLLEIVNSFHPEKGDVLYVKPGTIHAAEGHILVAEIQESSDLTFRLYDWGREFNPATARTMHLEEALDMVDYSAFDPSNLHRGADRKVSSTPTELVKLPQFCVSEVFLSEPLQIKAGRDGSFTIYMCIEGSAEVQLHSTDGRVDRFRIERGRTMLIPAEIEEFYLVPTAKDTLLLEVYVPDYVEPDAYIDPSTEPYLEGENYEVDEDDL